MNLRECGKAIGNSERHVQRLLDSLEASGYITRVRQGRGILCTVRRSATLAEAGTEVTLGAFLDVLSGPG